MKHLIIIAILWFIPYIGNAQSVHDTRVCEAYAHQKMIYNEKTKNYDEFDQYVCSIPVIIFNDKIKIKDDKQSMFFFKGTPVKTINDGYTDFTYRAYDRFGKDCTVVVETGPGTTVAAIEITYNKTHRYSYLLKAKDE